ncbi:MAG: hypothetical protein ABJC09_10650 [Terriglobia bacterium]
MEGIQVTAKGRKLLFTTTGQVADTSGAAPVVKGTWQPDSTAKDNTIGYTLDGAAQTSVPATYAFTADNQLSVALKGDALSPAFVFPGSIEVDRNHDFQYHVIDSTGADTGAKFTLYGAYEFEETTNDLVLHLKGGGEAHVAGDSGTQSLEAARNHLASFKGEDLLTYNASTVNQFPGQNDPIVKPAILAFAGGWDIQNGTVIFLSEIQGSPGKEAVTLGFAGKFKGVTTGFVYHTDGNTTEVALNISGQHVFRSDRAATNLAWETSIGFSAKRFDAQIEVKSTTNLTAGQTLAIAGKLHIQQSVGGPLTLDFNLEATYKFEAGVLVFKAHIQDQGLQTSYDLMLQGSFVYRNLQLTFSADFGSAAGTTTVAASVGIVGNRTSMIQNLQLMLNISQSAAALQVNLSFEARLHFVNGKRVIEKTTAAPKILTAGNP